MATAEAKPETMEANPLPPDAKVWVLRVSIHCEGCKKKVIKIMNKIQGVYRTEVDVKQHKVTVIGNVEVETVIKSLEKKTGRKVELCPQPEKAAPREKKQSRSKNREEPPKQQEQEQTKEAPDNGDKKPKAAIQEKIELEPPIEAETSSKKSENGGDGGKTSEKGKETAEEEEAKKGETVPAGIQPEGAEKGGGEDKKMKGQNGNNTNSDNEEECGEKGCSRRRQPSSSRGSTDPSPGSSQTKGRTRQAAKNMIQLKSQEDTNTMPLSQEEASHHPVHNEYPSSYPNPPPHYYMPPHEPPVYTVSYHASYPTASGYGASYYGPPPPGSSYMYMHSGQEIEAPSGYNPYPYLDESANVFERFSDENPNACSIM